MRNDSLFSRVTKITIVTVLSLFIVFGILVIVFKNEKLKELGNDVELKNEIEKSEIKEVDEKDASKNENIVSDNKTNTSSNTSRWNNTNNVTTVNNSGSTSNITNSEVESGTNKEDDKQDNISSEENDFIIINGTRMTITLDNLISTNKIYQVYGVGVYTDAGMKKRMTNKDNNLNIPKRDGYIFKGYYTKPDGNGIKLINDKGYITDQFTNKYFSHSDTIYAYWKEKSKIDDSIITPDIEEIKIYTISLNSQGADKTGTITIEEKYNKGLFINNKAMTAKANNIIIPTKNGYVFNGYYTEKDGKGVQLINDKGYITDQFTNNYFNSNNTLFASWKISYPDKINDERCYVNGNIRIKYYITECQSINTNNSQCKYTLANGRETFGTVSRNKLLTSLVECSTFTIKLDNQGDLSSNIYLRYGVGIYLDSDKLMTDSSNNVSIPKKDGYMFKGYYTEVNGKGFQLINEKGYITNNFSNKYFSKDSVIYAYFVKRNDTQPVIPVVEVKVYNITLDGQGSTKMGTTTIFEKYNVGIYLDSNYSKNMTANTNNILAPFKDGYTFGGYYTEKDGKGIQLINERGYITDKFINNYFSKNSTLYAYWKVAYTDTINGERCYKDGDTRIKYYITECQTNRISGGICKFSKADDIVKSGIVIRNKLTTDLKECSMYTVILDEQSATKTGTKLIYGRYVKGLYLTNYLNDSKKMSATSNNITIPERSGYTFNGYYTEKNGKGLQIINNKGYVTSNYNSKLYSSNVTLYAYWTMYYPDKINGNRCYVDGDTKVLYYITECQNITGGVCKYTAANGVARAGTVVRNKLTAESNCKPKYIEGEYFAPIQSVVKYTYHEPSVTPGCGSSAKVYHDILIEQGIPVYAAFDGTARFRQTSSTSVVSGKRVLTSYGNEVRLKSSDGTMIIYAHLSKFANGISTPVTESCPQDGTYTPCSATKYYSTTSNIVTKNVKKGELIGYTGMTGNAAVPHLHVEIHKYGGACVYDPLESFGMR